MIAAAAVVAGMVNVTFAAFLAWTCMLQWTCRSSLCALLCQSSDTLRSNHVTECTHEHTNTLIYTHNTKYYKVLIDAIFHALLSRIIPSEWASRHCNLLISWDVVGDNVIILESMFQRASLEECFIRLLSHCKVRWSVRISTFWPYTHWWNFVRPKTIAINSCSITGYLRSLGNSLRLA